MAIVTVNMSGGADYTNLNSAIRHWTGTTWAENLEIDCLGAGGDNSLENIRFNLANIGTQNGFKLIIRCHDTYIIDLTTYVRNYDQRVDFIEPVFRSVNTGADLWFIWSTYASQTYLEKPRYILPTTFAGRLTYSTQTALGFTKIKGEAVRGQLTGAGHIFDATTNFDIRESTLSNFSAAVGAQGTTSLPIVRDCAFLGNTIDVNDLVNYSGVSYCAFDNGKAVGSNSVSVTDWTAVFTDPSTGDFSLLVTDTLLTGAGSTGNNIGADQPEGETFNVTYDGNENTGGSVPVDSTGYTSGATVTVLGNTGSLVRTGYLFAGWNTQADGLGTDRAPNSTFSITANTRLYAKWTQDTTTYTVTYNGNGNTSGDVPVDTEEYLTGEPFTVLTNSGNLVKNGFPFSHWNTLANGSGISYDPLDVETMGTANVQLYAIYNETTTFRVEYLLNNAVGATLSGDLDQTIEQGENGTQVSVSVNSGYMFLGWKRGDEQANTPPLTHTALNVQSNRTITAMVGLIDPITSGNATFGAGGRYIDLIHVSKNIGTQAATGKITITPASGVVSDEAYTRIAIVGNLNGQHIEFDLTCSNGNKLYLLGTGSTQHYYCIGIIGGGTVEFHHYDLVTFQDTGYAYRGAYPRNSHFTLIDHHSSLRVLGTVTKLPHPWYVYGGNHDGGDTSLCSLKLIHYCSLYCWNTIGHGSEFLESLYGEPRQVEIEMENITLHCPSGTLQRWRAVGTLTGFVRNTASIGLRDYCFEAYQTTPTNIMTSDATGTAGLINVTPSEQFVSLDHENASYLLPVEGSLADIGGSAPTLSTTDYNDKEWESPYSIGAIQRDRDATYYDITVSATNGTVSPSGVQSVLSGSDLEIEATPATGYHLTGFNVSSGLTYGVVDNVCTLTNILQSGSVEAVHAINVYSVEYTAGAGGSITGNTSQSVNHGSNATEVTAVPDSGYKFVSWSDGVLAASRTDTNITGALSVSASFSLLTTSTVTYNQNNATTPSDPISQDVVEPNTTVGVLPTPPLRTGYTFAGWYTALSGGTQFLANTVVTDDIEVFARWTINPEVIIGNFNATKVAIALLPKLESQFRLTNANTGFATLFNGLKAGGLVTATMNNMGTGYGFLSALKTYKGDGGNDVIVSNYNKTISSTSQMLFTFSINVDSVAVAKNLMGWYKDANNYLFFQIGTNGSIRVSYRFNGNTAILSAVTDALTPGQLYMISIYINGTEMRSKVNNGVIASFPISVTGLPVDFLNFNILNWSNASPSNGLLGICDCVIVQDGAFTDEEITQIHTLGSDLGGGITATDNGDGTMSLEAASEANFHKKKYFPFGNSFASWSKRKRNQR